MDGVLFYGIPRPDSAHGFNVDSNTKSNPNPLQISTGMMLLSTTPRVGIVLELDADGNVLQNLQSTQADILTEALEAEDGLYLGSFVNKFILKVPRSNFRDP